MHVSVSMLSVVCCLYSPKVHNAADKDSLTWYQPLEGGGLSNVRSSIVGRWVTHTSLGLMEKVGAAPVGAQAVSEMLQAGADSLIEGGRLGIFTPMYFFLARNPE